MWVDDSGAFVIDTFIDIGEDTYRFEMVIE